MILLVTGSTFLIIILLSLIAYYFIRRYYGAKVRLLMSLSKKGLQVMEYATQLISANPEYLSQNDVYKSDEWELPRKLLTVEDCIGKGTFGQVRPPCPRRLTGQLQVYKGFGHNLRSVTGYDFGPCAIKTVTETANSAERIHFLLGRSCGML